MDTQNQFTYFLLSTLIGLTGGLLYEIFAFFRLVCGCERGKCKVLGITLDVIFGLVFALHCIFTSFWLRFPDFRGYMGVGWLIGLIIYSKTLRRIVAFCEKVCYNSIASMVKRAKRKKKTLKREDLDI